MKTFIITLWLNKKNQKKLRPNEMSSFVFKSNHENLKAARTYAKLLKERDQWDFCMVNEPIKEFTGLAYSSLQSLIDSLKVNGITDFSKVEFELDYGNCYYESDTPGIMAVVKD